MPETKTKSNNKNGLDEGLVVRRLKKSYGLTPVLENIDLHLLCGEAVALLGPNGAGKTTCFYAIAGLVRPDEGEVFIDGINVTGLPVYRRARAGLGYLPQEESIFRSLTVEENVRAVVEMTAIAPKKERVEQLLQEFSLAHLAQQKATSLSGGERRRLETARALAVNPRYLLLDEPLAGVDPVSVEEINQIILMLKKRGVGVLITDHNVREALRLVDRAYILYDGHILKAGRPEQILTDEKVREVYLGDSFTG